MAGTVLVDYHFTASSATSGWDQGAATVRGEGVTAALATWNLNADVKTSDSVSLSSSLGNVKASTADAGLTAALAQLIQGATAVDPTTGLREINQGLGTALAGQVSKLLTDSGFSDASAAAASQSLIGQLSSNASKPIALPLESQSQVSGSYSGSLIGGQELTSWNVQTTTTLNIDFDAANDTLSLSFDQHKVASTSVEWSSPTAGGFSIALTQPELQAISFIPSGSKADDTASPVSETQATSYVPDPAGTVAESNVAGYLPPDGSGTTRLAGLTGLLNFVNQTNKGAIAPTDVVGPYSPAPNPTKSSPLDTGNSATGSTPGQAAIAVLKNVLKQIKSQAASNDQAGSASVTLTHKQQVGVVGTTLAGGKFVLYTRPTGDKAIIHLPSLNVQA